MNVKKKLKEICTPAWNNQRNWMGVFTCERYLRVPNRDKIEEICRWAISNEYVFAFSEDAIEKFFFEW